MKKLLLGVLCLFTAELTYAQQDKQLTHYMFDRMSFNPAMTGFEGYSGTLIYRNQWDRVQDAPNTTVFNVQGNMQNLNLGSGGLGLGLSFSNDAIGYQRNNILTFNAAYHLPTNYGKLSAGFGIGIINVGFNPSWVPPTNDYDAVIASISNPTVGTGFDSNFGVYWYGNPGYYVGFSTTHLTPANLSKVNFSVARHYYLNAGFKHEIGIRYLNRKYPYYLRPSLLVKADGATGIFDLNLTLDIWLNDNSHLWAGATYRFSDAIGLMVGYGKNALKVGYSFDIMTNSLSKHGRGSHELMINYALFPPAHPMPRHGCPIILQ